MENGTEPLPETPAAEAPADPPEKEEEASVTAGWKIKIENYYGPLDLLLHLVKEAEIDVTRVTLAQVASQYIAFIEAMRKLDIDIASDFLITASQLLLIKTRSILPQDEEEEEEEEEDTSLDLIRRLLEYKIYKDRARELSYRQDEQRKKFPRPRIATREEKPKEEEPLRDMDVWNLVVRWARIAKSLRLDGTLDILYQQVPIEVFIEEVVTALDKKGQASFRELVGDPNNRGRIIGAFLAILELMKERRIDARQTEDGKDIQILPPAPEPDPIVPPLPPEPEKAVRKEAAPDQPPTASAENPTEKPPPAPPENDVPQPAPENFQKSENQIDGEA